MASRAEYQRAWRRRNPGRSKAYSRSNRIKHKERVGASNRSQRERVRAVVDALKSRPCMDCGNTFDPICMDFDHRPGESKTCNVGSIQYSVRRALEEIAKCDLVCANCHRLRTKQRRNPNTGDETK